MNLYTVLDTRAKKIINLLPLENDEVAIRLVKSMMENNTVMRANPHDFTLVRIGRYSEADGKIVDTEWQPVVTFDDIELE